jgi:hypothetical protein
MNYEECTTEVWVSFSHWGMFPVEVNYVAVTFTLAI